jgi:hypothetical protein
MCAGILCALLSTLPSNGFRFMTLNIRHMENVKTLLEISAVSQLASKGNPMECFPHHDVHMDGVAKRSHIVQNKKPSLSASS